MKYYKKLLGSLCVGILVCILILFWSNLLKVSYLQKGKYDEGKTKDMQLLDVTINDEKGINLKSITRLYSYVCPFYINVGFWENSWNPENVIPESMIEELQSAMHRGEIEDYAASISSDYTQMSKIEIIQRVRGDTSGILESYYYNIMKEGAEWFLFSRNGDIMVREKTDKEGYEYVYYKFPYVENGEYDIGLYAYGKTPDFYFIQWEGEDYLMVTRSETYRETIDGIGVYYMIGDNLLGTILCLDKDTDEVRFLSYVFNGNHVYGPPLPDY